MADILQENGNGKERLSEKQTKKLGAYALLASELGVDLSAVTRENFGKTLSYLEKEQFRHDLHEYVCGKVDDYSDVVADYIEADNVEDKYKTGHWKTALNILKDEFELKKQENGERADKEKLIEKALQVYATAGHKSSDGQTDEAIVKKTQSLLRSVSKVSQRDVIRSLSKKGKLKEDRFLKTLLKMGDLYEVQEFTEKSAQKHVESLLDKLESEQKKMYIETLKKMKLEKFIPQPEKQGEEKMAEDNQNIETTTENENTPASEKQTPAYKPRETLMKMARIANVGLNGIENDEALIAIIESKGYKVNGDQLLRIDGSNETEVDIDAEIKKLDDEAEKKANPLKVSADTNETNPQPAPQQDTEDRKWIEEKIAYYSALSSAEKIKDYQQDTSVTDGFAAEFNNSKIHYSSKTNVAVSKDAGYKVYDVMLKDPHNVGRPVNFSDNMTPEMAARLYAACIMNGNKVGGAVPQLTDEMKEQLKEEMGAEDYAVFEGKLAARMQNASEQNSQAQQERTEPTAEEIKQAMKDQYKMSVMENDGTINKTAEGPVKGENGSDEALQEYKEMSERAQTGKPMLFEQFKKSPEEFRKLMNEVIEEEKLHDKIDQLKLKRLKGEETKDEVNARREENKNIIKASLGIIDSYTDSNGVEHKKLEGDSMKQFVKERGINQYTYRNLGGKDETFAATLPEYKPNIERQNSER